MKIHVLQHSKNTPPGTLTEWAESRGHCLEISQLYEGSSLPKLEEVEYLVILGGPMNVDDEDSYPWLREEKAFLRAAIDSGRTCVGLCLGGQLLAQTLGATVRKHEHWEVGWHPIFMGADRLMVFQWHQDTFSLPPDCVRVATNRVTENQGFAYRNNIVGLQFHPEATETWINECLADPAFPQGDHVQSPEQIVSEMVFLHPMKKWFFELLSHMELVTKTNSQNIR